MEPFQKRNPNLHVFSSHFHTDEQTPHIHIGFVPFIRNSKRGIDTRVSLKGALSEQEFKGGIRGKTERGCRTGTVIFGSKEELSDILHRQTEAEQETEQIMENNNTIRNLTGEYEKLEQDCREDVRAQLERMKELCKEHNSLYEKQKDLRGQKWKIEKSLER